MMALSGRETTSYLAVLRSFVYRVALVVDRGEIDIGPQLTEFGNTVSSHFRLIQTQFSQTGESRQWDQECIIDVRASIQNQPFELRE